MPFPLAHPAAVLPFRRYCPRWLNFPALIIGSLVPDLSYCTGIAGLGQLAHSFMGSFEFALPAGLVSVLVFYLFRRPFVRFLPERFRNLFMPLCERRAGPFWSIIISVLIGSWTHIGLDSMSHYNGWVVEKFPLFRESVGLFLGHRMSVYQVCWFGFTFIGVAWLSIAYLKWLNRVTGTKHLAHRNVRTVYALVMAGLTVALGVVHRLLDYPLEMYPIIVGMILLAAAFVVVVGLRLQN